MGGGVKFNTINGIKHISVETRFLKNRLSCLRVKNIICYLTCI